VQVDFSNALLLHVPEDVAYDMSQWHGHFGSLMPFYRACERRGGFVGKAQVVSPTPDKLAGAEVEVPRGEDGERLGVELDALQLYVAPKRSNEEVVDWAASILCDLPRQ
jgi:hypothetical protein